MYHLTANRPCDTLALDFAVLERSTSGLENVLVITDIFSMYTMAVPTKDQRAKSQLLGFWLTNGFYHLGFLEHCILTKAGHLKIR